MVLSRFRKQIQDHSPHLSFLLSARSLRRALRCGRCRTSGRHARERSSGKGMLGLSHGIMDQRGWENGPEFGPFSIRRPHRWKPAKSGLGERFEPFTLGTVQQESSGIIGNDFMNGLWFGSPTSCHLLCLRNGPLNPVDPSQPPGTRGWTARSRP